MTRPRPIGAAIAVAVLLPLTLLVGLGWRPLTDADRSADVAAHTLVGHGALLAWARALTHLGAPTVVTALSVVGAVACWFGGRRRDSVYLLVVRAVAVVLGAALKTLVGRARPLLAHPVAHASGYSFPSGHALGAAATYLSLALVAARLWPRLVPATTAVAVLVAVVVAATRVLLGVHYPSDVAAGLVLGWAIAGVGRGRPIRP